VQTIAPSACRRQRGQQPGHEPGRPRRSSNWG
jgi:hypothetical protein